MKLKKIKNAILKLKLKELKNKNTERIFLSVDTALSHIMPMECVRTAIMLKGEPRKHSNAHIQIEFSMLKVSVRIVTYPSTTNAREIPLKKELLKTKALKNKLNEKLFSTLLCHPQRVISILR